MSLPATIRAMRAAGVPADQIIETVLAIEEERLAKGRARTAKSRNKHNKRDVTSVTHVTGVTAAPEKEIPPDPHKKTTPPDSSPTGNISTPHAKPTPRTELSSVLDAERTQAVIEHRQRIRKPLTAHAAKLLAGKFSKAPDPNAAADTMVANGWQGFEPEWLNGRAAQPRASPSDRTTRMQAAIEETRGDFQ